MESTIALGAGAAAMYVILTFLITLTSRRATVVYPLARSTPKSQVGAVLLSTPVSTLLLWVGLFTASWDRFFQFAVGSFNLKISIVALALSLALTVFNSRQDRKTKAGHAVVTCTVVILATYLLAALFAESIQLAIVQLATIILGAVIPMLATVWNTRMFGRLEQALTAFIYGGMFASFFGLYQLVAFYTGLPQGIIYRATSGGLGRISSFSYEAGYFGYFLALVVGAVFARAHLRGMNVSKLQVLFLFGVMILANSRATVFVLPLLLVLLLFRKPTSSVQTKLVPVAVVGALLLAFAWLLFPSYFEAIAARAGTVFDTTEQTSNAPRLGSFAVAWELIQGSPVVGIGGGNLRDAAAGLTGVVDDRLSANEVIANNVWLQAMLDGGAILLLAEVALVLVAGVTLYRRRTPAARFLIGSWLTVLLVSSMITSYFFDVKMWVVLGLAVALSEMTPYSQSVEAADAELKPSHPSVL